MEYYFHYQIFRGNCIVLIDTRKILNPISISCWRFNRGISTLQWFFPNYLQLLIKLQFFFACCHSLWLLWAWPQQEKSEDLCAWFANFCHLVQDEHKIALCAIISWFNSGENNSKWSKVYIFFTKKPILRSKLASTALAPLQIAPDLCQRCGILAKNLPPNMNFLTHCAVEEHVNRRIDLTDDWFATDV